MRESHHLRPAPLSRSEALASHDVASAVADAAADGAAGGEAAWRVPLEGVAREAAAGGDAPAVPRRAPHSSPAVRRRGDTRGALARVCGAGGGAVRRRSGRRRRRRWMRRRLRGR